MVCFCMDQCDTGCQEDQALHILEHVPGQNWKHIDDLQDAAWQLVRFNNHTRSIIL